MSRFAFPLGLGIDLKGILATHGPDCSYTFFHWERTHCNMKDLKIRKSKNILQRQHSA